jgi:ComF family protein
MQRAAASVLDFALPPRCPACGNIVTRSHSFCFDCWTSLEFLGEPACARCGLPFEFDQVAGAECGECLREPPAFDRMRAAVAYGPVARNVALKLKYGRRPGVAETLASLMRRHLNDIGADAILAPVPLHRWRIWRRGYNQAGLIASSLAKHDGRRCSLDLLHRKRATPSMRGLGRSERARVVRGAFEVRAEAKALAEGQTIVLVDDIYTSGATGNACARALKRAGAKRVDILCWARVVASDG